MTIGLLLQIYIFFYNLYIDDNTPILISFIIILFCHSSNSLLLFSVLIKLYIKQNKSRPFIKDIGLQQTTNRILYLADLLSDVAETYSENSDLLSESAETYSEKSERLSEASVTSTEKVEGLSEASQTSTEKVEGLSESSETSTGKVETLPDASRTYSVRS